MGKIRIMKTSVLNLEYTGKTGEGLERGYNYVAVVTEGVNEEGSLLIINIQNGDRERIIYDSFVSFAQDWKVLGDFKFKE